MLLLIPQEPATNLESLCTPGLTRHLHQAASSSAAIIYERKLAGVSGMIQGKERELDEGPKLLESSSDLIF